MSDYQLSLRPKTLENSDDQQKSVLEQGQQALGFIPNMFANMANVPALLQVYLDAYGQFREHSTFSPAEQEVVLLTVSRHNGCSYCMAAHSMIADQMSGVPKADLEKLRNGQPLQDEKLAALNRFARHMLETQGMPRQAEVEHFLAAGFKESQILEVVLAVAIKTLSNYSNHLFKTRVDDAFKDYLWSPD